MMAQQRKRSVMGVGVTTLVTIMVVLLLTVFAVLTLASARADEHLSQMAANATNEYYAADGEATHWFAGLIDVVEANGNDDNATALGDAGYTIRNGENDSLLVSNVFEMGSNRQLTVTVHVDRYGGCNITQWQTSAKEQ
jgi:hypothetical protein